MIAAGSNDTTVAESAVAMILALARELYAYVTNTAEGDWSRGLMNEIRDKTIGVVGLGRIGKSVVRRLAGFDPVLIAAEPYPDHWTSWTNTALSSWGSTTCSAGRIT